jgi:hypothetical protein
VCQINPLIKGAPPYPGSELRRHFQIQGFLFITNTGVGVQRATPRGRGDAARTLTGAEEDSRQALLRAGQPQPLPLGISVEKGVRRGAGAGAGGRDFINNKSGHTCRHPCTSTLPPALSSDKNVKRLYHHGDNKNPVLF